MWCAIVVAASQSYTFLNANFQHLRCRVDRVDGNPEKACNLEIAFYSFSAQDAHLRVLCAHCTFHVVLDACSLPVESLGILLDRISVAYFRPEADTCKVRGLLVAENVAETASPVFSVLACAWTARAEPIISSLWQCNHSLATSNQNSSTPQ
jgi:hypothetical protein